MRINYILINYIWEAKCQLKIILFIFLLLYQYYPSLGYKLSIKIANHSYVSSFGDKIPR